MSNFSFVTDPTLRSNLDRSFAHIIDLLALSESETYKGKGLLVSSLRKTIIIHTASIIEALLFWKLKEEYNVKKIELIDEWKYIDMRIIHQISSSEEVIAGKRKKEVKDMNKLDFLRVTDLCYKYKILKPQSLRSEVDRVRELRNRLHIGGLVSVEKEYTKEDLEFCFNVARKIKNLVQQ